MATIRKRTLPSGKVAWQVDFKDRNGKRRARQFPTKREADAFMVKARAEVATGTYVHDADSVTVGEAAAQWLAGCAQRRDVGRRMEKATWVGYECHIRLHICEPDIGIGRIKLSRLTRKVINEFRDRLLSGGRSETTTRKILSSFNLIVRHAQENGMIVQNPVQGIRVIRSRRVRKTVQVSVKENVRRLIDASGEDFKPYLIVAALCGLRASEQRALRWEDVDFSGAQILVRQRADAYNEIGEPKSSAGHRSIPMGPFVANTLKLWKWRCPPSPLGLVLSISGEDFITIDRKFLPAWTGKLPTRFLILTNEVPRLADTSGALASRFIVLNLTKSFYNREDLDLKNRLLGELPAILNWAIEGWQRLQDRGHFLQPPSSADIIEALEDLGSPVGAFVREKCVIEPGKEVACSTLFEQWKTWCEDAGRKQPGTKQSFGRDLRAAVPGIKTTQPRAEDSSRCRFYQGIGLA